MYICDCCQKNNFYKILDLGKQPFANKYFIEDELSKEKTQQMDINFCLNCFTANTNTIISRDYMFKNYFYLSSVNNELVTHFKKLANKIPPYAKLLDVGSNDGILLKLCKKKNIDTLGIDPSENVGKIANDQGLETIIGFFDNENVDFIINKYGQFDFVVASSIFTHVDNPSNFIENIYKVLSKDGTFILEIEYIYNIISKYEFERFYFDRPFYYSVTGIHKLITRYGLFIDNIEEISPHGGSLRFYIKKIKNQKSNQDLFFEKEFNYFRKESITNYQNKITQLSISFKKFLEDCKFKKKKVAAFGCPARFSTITNFADIDRDLINYVVDDNILKAGKLSPGKHIPIYPRKYMLDNEPDLIIVFAYEYFKSINTFTKNFNVEQYKPIPLIKLN